MRRHRSVLSTLYWHASEGRRARGREACGRSKVGAVQGSQLMIEQYKETTSPRYTIYPILPPPPPSAPLRFMGQPHPTNPSPRAPTRSMGQPMLMSMKSATMLSPSSCPQRASASGKPPHTWGEEGEGGIALGAGHGWWWSRS